jgi:hypothetical protein
MWWGNRSRGGSPTPSEVVSTLDEGVDALFNPARYVSGFIADRTRSNCSPLCPQLRFGGGVIPGLRADVVLFRCALRRSAT